MNENEVRDRMREHIIVFVCLIGLTLLAVWVSQNGTGPVRVMVLGIVACQVIMVAGILMHLMGEKPAVSSLVVLTVFLVTALFVLVLATSADRLTGTQSMEPGLSGANIVAQEEN